MGPLTKGIGGLIGLGTEIYAHQKEKKQIKQSVSEDPRTHDRLNPAGSYSRHEKRSDDDESSSDSEVEGDDEDWALDDAAAELEKSDRSPPSYEEAISDPGAVVDGTVASLIHQHPAAFQVHKGEEVPLPCPVILPQRRPTQKERGFVRAYAPVLGECKGIDQDTFMSFLKDFDRSTKASPVFDVINIAAMIAGSVPSPIAMGVSIGVQILSKTGQEVQGRYRTNTYLNRINETLFMPHGLYCMIMTYKPDQPGQAFVAVNTNDAITSSIAKSLERPDNKLKATMGNLRLSSGTSKGEMTLPETAPLIFPTLDAAVTTVDGPLDAQKQNKLKSSQQFLADYLDRRNQAKFAGANPGSKLAMMPQKEFSSRYADPNSAVYNGGLITFITGGNVDLRGGRSARKADRRVRRGERRASRRGYELTEEQRSSLSEPRRARRGNRRQRKGLIRRAMQSNVLYLMICNLPTEEEMAIAREQLKKMR